MSQIAIISSQWMRFFALDDLERGLISEVIVGYGDTMM
tara:strand:- start:35 stop:148 length:114 start_codon:yes stop_codon:yes gene_type:complete